MGGRLRALTAVRSTDGIGTAHGSPKATKTQDVVASFVTVADALPWLPALSVALTVIV
jgi:hypothetical protein